MGGFSHVVERSHCERNVDEWAAERGDVDNVEQWCDSRDCFGVVVDDDRTGFIREHFAGYAGGFSAIDFATSLPVIVMCILTSCVVVCLMVLAHAI